MSQISDFDISQGQSKVSTAKIHAQSTYCLICLEPKHTVLVANCCKKIICEDCSKQNLEKNGNKCPTCKINLEMQSCVYANNINKKIKYDPGSNTVKFNEFQTNCVECNNLAHQALVFSCCGCLICEECKPKLDKKQHKKCPDCREKNYQLKNQPFVRKLILQLSKDIQIFVKPINGGTIIINIKQFDTIETLFKMVNIKEGIPIPLIRLCFGGKNLMCNEKTLANYFLRDSSTVNMLLRMKGGNS